MGIAAPTSLTLDTGTATPAATAAMNFANNKLYLICVSWRAGAARSVSSITGGGMTWTLVKASAIYGSNNVGMEVWRGLVTSGALSAAALTITMSGAIQRLSWEVVEDASGFDTSGTNGSGAIVQSAENGATGSTSLAVALASFADATNDMAIGFFSVNGQQNPLVVDASPAGYTAIAGGQSSATNPITRGSEYLTGQDTSVSASWMTGAQCVGIAIEIRVAPPVAKSGSDTGSGSDAATLAAGITGPDTGSGADAGTLAAAGSSAEIGAGADAGALVASIAGTETGSGTDAASLAAAGTSAETGSGADAGTLVASIAGTETGSGTDAGTLAASLAATDSGTGADAATTATLAGGSESGSGADAASLVASTAATETGSALDAGAIGATLTGADAAVVAEAEAIVAAALAAETGVGADDQDIEITEREATATIAGTLPALRSAATARLMLPDVDASGAGVLPGLTQFATAEVFKPFQYQRRHDDAWQTDVLRSPDLLRRNR